MADVMSEGAKAAAAAVMERVMGFQKDVAADAVKGAVLGTMRITHALQGAVIAAFETNAERGAFLAAAASVWDTAASSRRTLSTMVEQSVALAEAAKVEGTAATGDPERT